MFLCNRLDPTSAKRYGNALPHPHQKRYVNAVPTPLHPWG